MSEKTIIKRTFTNPVYPHGAYGSLDVKIAKLLI